LSIIKFKFVEKIFKNSKNINMKNLREFRKRNNILQKDLAAQLGVAISTFSGWESGSYEIDNKNLIKLSKILGVSIEFLLDVENNPSLFDDARLPKSEIQELFDGLTPAQQENLLNYARGMAVSNALEDPSTVKKHA